ncbi:MAG: LuxR C-terminal-related transcriptional regulator [Phototrophicaceae bacterium]
MIPDAPKPNSPINAIIKNIRDVVILVTVSGEITYIMQSIERLTGYTTEELHSIYDLVFPSDHEALNALIHSTFTHDYYDGVVELRLQHRDHFVVYVECLPHLLRMEVPLIALTMRDIMEKKVFEMMQSRQAINERELNLYYGQQILRNAEMERRRVGELLYRLLHTHLSSLELTLDSLTYAEDKNLTDTIPTLSQLVRKLHHELQATALELSEDMLEQTTLPNLIRWVALRYEQRYGLKVRVSDTPLGESPLSLELKKLVYRVIHEALKNVVDHAGVDFAEVVIDQNAHKMSITIRDHGQGFNLKEMLHERQVRGLWRMLTHARLHHAELEMQSIVEQGTTIKLVIPMDTVTEPANHDYLHHPYLLSNNISGMRDTSPRPQLDILIAASHPIMLRGLKSYLADAKDIHVVAETTLGSEVLSLVELHMPHVILAEVNLANVNGIEIARRLQQSNLGTRVLLLGNSVDTHYIQEVYLYGALGYLPKTASSGELIEAIRQVGVGQRYINAEFITAIQESKLDIDEAYHDLTEREREILQLVAEGYTNAAIAEKLTISPRTAETHRANMMRKLDLKNPSEVIRYALKRGIIELES